MEIRHTVLVELREYPTDRHWFKVERLSLPADAEQMSDAQFGAYVRANMLAGTVAAEGVAREDAEHDAYQMDARVCWHELNNLPCDRDNDLAS